jgi:hypothetical protein
MLPQHRSGCPALNGPDCIQVFTLCAAGGVEAGAAGEDIKVVGRNPRQGQIQAVRATMRTHRPEPKPLCLFVPLHPEIIGPTVQANQRKF